MADSDWVEVPPSQELGLFDKLGAFLTRGLKKPPTPGQPGSEEFIKGMIPALASSTAPGSVAAATKPVIEGASEPLSDFLMRKAVRLKPGADVVGAGTKLIEQGVKGTAPTMRSQIAGKVAEEIPILQDALKQIKGEIVVPEGVPGVEPGSKSAQQAYSDIKDLDYAQWKPVKDKVMGQIKLKAEEEGIPEVASSLGSQSSLLNARAGLNQKQGITGLAKKGLMTAGAAKVGGAVAGPVGAVVAPALVHMATSPAALSYAAHGVSAASEALPKSGEAALRAYLSQYAPAQSKPDSDWVEVK